MPTCMDCGFILPQKGFTKGTCTFKHNDYAMEISEKKENG